MKISSVIIFIFLAGPACCQLHESFDDGDLTFNPVWTGNTNSFFVNSEHELQLNAAGAGTSSLSTSIDLHAPTLMEWQISVRQSFSPSGSNYARVYLASDEPDLAQPLHGYFLRLGEAGTNDAITLFRQDGSAIVELCRGTAGEIASAFHLTIKVILDHGTWSLTSAKDSAMFIPEAAAHDGTYGNFRFFGLLCSYTASNANKFAFDNIDISGRSGDTTSQSNARYKDVIITEILPDPSPAIGLPDTEFIEIYNRASSAIDLSGWSISDGGTPARISSGTLQPNEWNIIVSKTFVSSWPDAFLLTPFPSLNNDADYLILKDQNGKTIDSIRYDKSWYHDRAKEEGGWSLEIIDVNNVCGEADNWTASEDPSGGTPARANSVSRLNQDVEGPRLLRVATASSTSITLHFDEKLSRDISTTEFSFAPEVSIRSFSFSDHLLRSIDVQLTEPLAASTRYTVTVTSLSDCSGNEISSEHNQMTFALPQEADSMDIVINEVLFNPRPSGSDFVELYNASDKFINIGRWKIANSNDGVLTNVASIVDADFIMAPGSWICLTADKVAVKNNYPDGHEDTFMEVKLPSLPDDAGSVAIVNPSGTVMDFFSYTKEMHSSLVKNDEGVSIERISAQRPTQEISNWASASSYEHFASPGYRNSCYRPTIEISAGSIMISPEIFAPGSGIAEFTMISYRFDNPGYTGNIAVVDQFGRVVRSLANNETLGVDGIIRWDGEMDNGARARVGYYIIWFQVFDLTGSVQTYRKRVILTSLN